MDLLTRKRIRIPDYDYSQQGIYFITICSAEKRMIFGHVDKGDEFILPWVELSDLGRIVKKNIEYIPNAYEGVFVNHYVIMPNHIHLLLQIDKSDSNKNDQPSKMLVPRIVQSFKASVTRQIKGESNPIWQKRYYDHVVRNEQDYLRIWEYIDCNPAKWSDDEYFIR